MKSIKILDAMGNICDELIADAAIPKGRPTGPAVWVKWGAVAAGLCLVLGLSGHLFFHPDAAAGPVSPGGIPGSLPDHIDPITASIAVYPATEELQNVKSATIVSMDQEDAYSFETLGKHLPAVLPEGYQFEKASLYETTMQDGTKYYQLRVTYCDGITVEPSTAVDPETGESLQNAPAAIANSFTVFVMNYQPDTDKTIYSGKALMEYVKALPNNGVFHFFYDGLYFGFAPLSLHADEVLSVIDSMGTPFAESF